VPEHPHESPLNAPPIKRRSRPLIRALLIAAVVVAAAVPKIRSELLGGTSAGGAPAVPPAGGGTARASAQAAPLKVSAVVVEPRMLAETVSSTGTLIAVEAVDLQAEVSGKITAITFREGAHVKRGDLLVKLNDADLQARRAGAIHQLELAETREQRASDLLTQGFVIQDAHDGAVATTHVRRADLALVEAEIDKTEIRAPFDGVAGLRYVSEGAFVGAATKIATLQRVDTLKVDFAIPERYAPKVKIGSPIKFSVDGRAEEFGGEVYAYDPRIDPETRTLLLRALCPNPGGVLLPGAFANVRLVLAELADALLIPAEALIPDFEAAYVFVAKDGKAERRRVVTGTRTDTSVQVLDGLAAGDVVVTSGLQQLRAGAPIKTEIAGEQKPAGHSSHEPVGHAPDVHAGHAPDATAHVAQPPPLVQAAQTPRAAPTRR
jgi:membrane fusion protein, multidrug efflux system